MKCGWLCQAIQAACAGAWARLCTRAKDSVTGACVPDLVLRGTWCEMPAQSQCQRGWHMAGRNDSREFRQWMWEPHQQELTLGKAIWSSKIQILGWITGSEEGEGRNMIRQGKWAGCPGTRHASSSRWEQGLCSSMQRLSISLVSPKTRDGWSRYQERKKKI